MCSLLPVWSYAASPRAFPGKCHCWKTEQSGRMKPFFRSALVLIHAAAPGACSEPGEGPMQGSARMGTVFQPILTPYRRDVETNSGSAAREVDNRTKMSRLDKTCTYEEVILKYKSCVLSTFIRWCSVLSTGHRIEWLAGKGHCLARAMSHPIKWHRAGYSPPKEAEQCWWRLPS